jgi:tetratricopeptide (TPR) repeat protein
MINKTLVAFTIILLSSCFLGQKSSDLFKNKESENLFIKAQEHQIEGNLDSALFYFNKADKEAPNTPVILHERGLIKSNMKLYTEAISDINKSIELVTSEKKKEVWINNRALVYMDMGDMDNACKDWAEIGSTSYLKKYCK